MTRQNTYVVIAVYSKKNVNFWPQSRKDRPKQFLDLFGNGRSLVQLAYERSKGICDVENILFLIPKEYLSLLHQQIPDLSDDQILVEPVRRNSAPSIAYACCKIKKKNANAIIAICPADQHIFGEIAYVRDIRRAVEYTWSDKNKLLIIGIKPHKPETSYNYIQYHYDTKATVKKVKTFTKRPQSDLASLFIESGDFVWNTKTYVWHVDAITDALKKYVPDVFEAFDEGSENYYSDNEEHFVYQAFSHSNNVSISNSILEKADNVYLLIGEFDWCGLSSWKSYYEKKDKDDNGNVLDGNAYIINSKDCLIKGSDQKLLVVEGLEGYQVIDSEDALLICPIELSDKVKGLYGSLKGSKYDKYT